MESGVGTPARERRCKLYSLSWPTVMRLAQPEHDNEFVSFPKLKLPADAAILGVYNNQLTGGFDFHVASQEFDPVDDAVELPRVVAECEIVRMPKANSHLLEMAWGVIANAGGGDWGRESPEWRAAARRFRDAYHAAGGEENNALP